MTDERNPQDHARELAETWISEILYVLPLVVDEAAAAKATDNLTAKFLAYRASLLAGAVPQEELRALWEKWRKSANKSRMALGKVNAEKQPEWSTELETNWHDLEMCADALESLIEKRR